MTPASMSKLLLMLTRFAPNGGRLAADTVAAVPTKLCQHYAVAAKVEDVLLDDMVIDEAPGLWLLQVGARQRRPANEIARPSQQAAASAVLFQAYDTQPCPCKQRANATFIPAPSPPPAPPQKSSLPKSDFATTNTTTTEAPYTPPPCPCAPTMSTPSPPYDGTTTTEYLGPMVKPANSTGTATAMTQKAKDCEVAPWSEWTNCGPVEGNGLRSWFQFRDRLIIQPQVKPGHDCPVLKEQRQCAIQTGCLGDLPLPF